MLAEIGSGLVPTYGFRCAVINERLVTNPPRYECLIMLALSR